MAAIDQALVSQILNSTTRVGNTVPTLTTPIVVRLDSTAATAAAPGTELTGAGYSRLSVTGAGGFTASAAGSSVTGPVTTPLVWTNSSGVPWTIVSLDIYDSAGSPIRTWFGLWTGQPITVNNTFSFQVNTSAITIALS
jgi:hypothetical protein